MSMPKLSSNFDFSKFPRPKQTKMILTAFYTIKYLSEDKIIVQKTNITRGKAVSFRFLALLFARSDEYLFSAKGAVLGYLTLLRFVR